MASAIQELTRSGTNLDDRVLATREKVGEIGSVENELKALNERVASVQPQLDKLQSKWKSALDELETQKQARTRDALRMTESIELLQVELAAAGAQEAVTRQTLSRELNVWRAISAFAGLTAVSFSCALVWQTIPKARETVSAPSPPRTIAPMVNWAVAPVQPQYRPALPEAPEAALTAGLDRLNDALVSVPGRSPEQALRRVSAVDPRCPLVWINNLPALVFGRRPIRPNSLATAMWDCADAVERLR